MSMSPLNLRAIRADRVLEIAWPDGLTVRIPFRYLRGRCPCAGCVNEFTNERMVDVHDIPEGIDLEAAQLTGNYALKVTWSDRHDTGLYTWEHLHDLCRSREWEPA